MVEAAGKKSISRQGTSVLSRAAYWAKTINGLAHSSTQGICSVVAPTVLCSIMVPRHRGSYFLPVSTVNSPELFPLMKWLKRLCSISRDEPGLLDGDCLQLQQTNVWS